MTSFQCSFVGDIGQVAHQAGLDQFLGLPAMVELGGAHRIAAGDAADHDRPCRIAGAGDGAVDPMVAGGVERLGEFGDCRRFAARRPPMGDFEIGRGSRAGKTTVPRSSRAQP